MRSSSLLTRRRWNACALPVRFRRHPLRFAASVGNSRLAICDEPAGGSSPTRAGIGAHAHRRPRPQSARRPGLTGYSRASSRSPLRTCSRTMPSDCSYRPSPSGVTNLQNSLGPIGIPGVVGAEMAEVVEEIRSIVVERSKRCVRLQFRRSIGREILSRPYVPFASTPTTVFPVTSSWTSATVIDTGRLGADSGTARLLGLASLREKTQGPWQPGRRCILRETTHSNTSQQAECKHWVRPF